MTIYNNKNSNDSFIIINNVFSGTLFDLKLTRLEIKYYKFRNNYIWLFIIKFSNIRLYYYKNDYPLILSNKCKENTQTKSLNIAFKTMDSFNIFISISVLTNNTYINES